VFHPCCHLHPFHCRGHPEYRFRWVVFVYVSHWVVDRFSLADKWLQLIHSRDLPGFVMNGHMDIPELEDDTPEAPRKMNYRILRGSFSAIVYGVVDNSIHLFSMYYFYRFFSQKSNRRFLKGVCP